MSCVLINGESNWSFVSEQLNKWMKHTTNCIGVPFSSSLSILGCNSLNAPSITLRTKNQCSKQFKFIAKNYSLKYGINDLKKVYQHLADERLKELKNLVITSRQQFTDVFNEIDQLFEMDTNNFEQLTEIWNNLKSAESSLTRSTSNYPTRSSIESRSSIDKTDLEEIQSMEKNIEKINAINRKKKEEAEAAILAAKKAVAEAAEKAAREAEAQRIKLKEKAELEQKQIEAKARQIEADKAAAAAAATAAALATQNEAIVNTQTEPTIEIKIEQNVPISNEEIEQNGIVSPKKEEGLLIKSTSLVSSAVPVVAAAESNVDKLVDYEETMSSSSEDDIPLSKLHKKKKETTKTNGNKRNRHRMEANRRQYYRCCRIIAAT